MPTVRPLLLGAALAASAGLAVTARQASDYQTQSFAAWGPAAGAASLRVEAMLADGRLQAGRLQEDTMVPGRVHERLVQHHQGVPVFASEVVRQIDGGGVRTVFGRTFEGIAVDTSPAVPAVEAGRLAADAIGGTAAAFEPAQLGVLPIDGGYALAWRVPVRGNWNVEDVYVDAGTGVILRRISRLRAQLGDIGVGDGVLGDRKKVAARRAGGGFEAHDGVRPGPIETFDFLGNPSRLQTFLNNGVLNDTDLARDADNVWDDGAVVDAHVHQGLTYDYFFKRYGRRGMDDANGLVTTVVHPLARSLAPQFDEEAVDLFVNNALYFGGRYLLFGDGDGQVFDYTAAALDIVAHEWTHGVMEYGANLIYEDESGALNEAFSDIMSAAVEFMYHEPGEGPRRADWVLGEDAFRAGPYVRSMSSPISAGHPDHYSRRVFIGTPIDNGGIHINSSIANHAFYLAVAGGTNRVSGLAVEGVGLANIDRMERIFYRGFLYFLTPRSGFSDARLATVLAAEELYGPSSPERAAVQQAWAAVGVN